MANIFKFSRDDEDDDDDGGDDDDDDDDDVDDDDDDDKQRLQTLSIDNAWFNKNFLYYCLDVSYATTYIFRSERL